MPIIESVPESHNDIPPATKSLALENGSLRKQSYVRLDHTYQIPLPMLAQYSWRRCRAYKIRISKSSYTTLMEELGLVPEVFEETNTLYETADRRLSDLAGAGGLAQDTTRNWNASANSQNLVFPQIQQHTLTYSSQPTLPTFNYGTAPLTQQPQYIPYSYQRTLPYSSSPGPSEGKSNSYFVIYLVGIGGICIVSFFWWKYSW
jgi:hypothetical protein